MNVNLIEDNASTCISVEKLYDALNAAVDIFDKVKFTQGRRCLVTPLTNLAEYQKLQKAVKTLESLRMIQIQAWSVWVSYRDGFGGRGNFWTMVGCTTEAQAKKLLPVLKEHYSDCNDYEFHVSLKECPYYALVKPNVTAKQYKLSLGNRRR